VTSVPVSSASAPSIPSDAVLLGTPGGDDEVRRTMANKVVVARSIGWRWRAEVWSELASAAACARVIPASVRAFC
jgi:hypothetical protein